MPLGGAKDEHFSCFHSSCHAEKEYRYSNKRKYLLSYPKGYVIPVNNMTVKRVLYSLLSNCFEGSMTHKVVALIVQVNILDQNLALMSHNKLLYSPQGD